MAKPTEAVANHGIDDFNERTQNKLYESVTHPKKSVLNNKMIDLDAQIQNKILADPKKILGKLDEFDEEAGTRGSYHHVDDHCDVVMPDKIQETYNQPEDKYDVL